MKAFPHAMRYAGFFASAWLASGGAANAQTAQNLRQQSLAATCAACHGTQGRAAPGAVMPRLAGLPRDYLLAQILAFRDGTRVATVMQQIAKGYSAEQIDALAAYFAAQK